MNFIRELDDAKGFDTGHPGHRAQFICELESATFFSSSVEEGGGAAGLHYHPSDQFYFLLRGTMTAQLGEVVQRVDAGSLVHIPAGLAHRNWNEGPGPETHLEAIVPAVPPGPPIAVMVDSPEDVPADDRSRRAASVMAVDVHRLEETEPGLHVMPLAGPGVGIDSMMAAYAEVEPGHGGQGTHIHEFDKYCFVLEGELTVDVALQHHVVGPDTLVVVPAGVPHRLWNNGRETEKHLAVLAPAPSKGVPRSRPVNLVEGSVR